MKSTAPPFPLRPAALLAPKERIYVFNVAGGLIGDYPTLEACAARLSLKLNSLRAALRRGSLTGGRYYLATSASFKPTQHNLTQNPLAINEHGAHAYALSGLEADFNSSFS